MRRIPVLNSVVTQLVTFLVVGGVLLSIALALLQMQRAESQLRLDLAQRATVLVRNLQAALVESGPDEVTVQQVRPLIGRHLTEDLVPGWRGTGATADPIEGGDWKLAEDRSLKAWTLREHGIGRVHDIDLDRPILVWAPFHIGDRTVLTEMLLDVPGAHRAMTDRVYASLRTQWLLLAVMSLMGLLLVRRRFTLPLGEVTALTSSGADAKSFARCAESSHGEFALLAESIAGMLGRLDETTEQLRRRETAYSDLFQFAPAALVNLDTQGQVVKANDRAVALMGAGSERGLVGQPIDRWVAPEDQDVLREAISHLTHQGHSRCEIKIEADGRSVDVAVEAAAVRDENDQLFRVRLSMLDVSQAKQLQHRLSEKSRLLNLLIDHMSDAILLVDDRGLIAAHNQQLVSLLGRPTRSLVGQSYDPRRLWSTLDIRDESAFLDRLKQIEAERHRPAQERVHTRVGTFLFQGIPVHDTQSRTVGRLWVVQEITAQEQAQQLLQQQTTQMQAVKQLCRKLCEIGGTDDLLVTSCEHLWDVLNVEAIGVAVRADASGRRARQMVHRGPHPSLLEPSRALIDAVERLFIPQVFASDDVSSWPTLTDQQPWAEAFREAGLTSVAGIPLRASSDAVGVLWIARRGGEPIGRHHTYLLETLAPLIAARVEVSQMRQTLASFEMTDPVTDLPNRRAFEEHVRTEIGEGSKPWTVAAVGIDLFSRMVEMTGDQEGEHLVRTVAAALRQVTRRSTFVARVGQSKFAVVVPGMPQAGAQSLGTRLADAVASVQAPLRHEEGEINLTASIGLASGPDDGMTGLMVAELALARAENARRSGGGHIVASGGLADRQAG